MCTEGHYITVLYCLLCIVLYCTLLYFAHLAMKLPMTGYRLLGSDYRLQVTDCTIFNYRLPIEITDFRFQLLIEVNSYRLPDTGRLVKMMRKIE